MPTRRKAQESYGNAGIITLLMCYSQQSVGIHLRPLIFEDKFSGAGATNPLQAQAAPGQTGILLPVPKQIVVPLLQNLSPKNKIK